MRSRPAVVGGFILGALALGIAAIVFFGGSELFEKKVRAVVFFNDSVAGLRVGAPVTFQGAQVGSVKNIAVLFSTDTLTARIRVLLQLDGDRVTWQGKKLDGTPADFGRLVQAGLRAQLVEESFVTGQMHVDLDFRPKESARLVGAASDIPEIPAVPSPFANLKDQLTSLPLRQLIDIAQQTLASVTRLSDHLDARIGPFVESAQRTVYAATQTLKTTTDALRQIQNGATTSLHNLDDLTIDARVQLDARSSDLGHTLADADAAVRQGQVVLNSLSGLVDPRSQFREDLAAATRDMAASASSLRGFSEQIERHPNALLLGRRSSR